MFKKRCAKNLDNNVPCRRYIRREETFCSMHKIYEMQELLEQYLKGKNINTFIHIIYTPTTCLEYDKKELMELYKQFHPDKSRNNEITQKLCTLISSKLSAINEKSFMGDLTPDLNSILN